MPALGGLLFAVMNKTTTSRANVGPAPLRRTVGTFARSVLGRCGYRVVRIDLPDHAPAENSGVFFPTGENRRGWTFPSDWDGPDRQWLPVLKTLYTRPASWPASISPEGGSFLYWLVRNVQPRQVIEIGTCVGASTIWMAAAMRANGGGVLHTFDDFQIPRDPRLAAAPLFQDRRNTVEARIRSAGLGDLVRFHVGDSKKQVPAAYEQLRTGGNVQFAFIDGDHSFEGVLGDLLAVEPVLEPGGYVVLHDVFPEVCGVEGPRQLLDKLKRLTKVEYRWCEIYTSPQNYGLAVLRRVP